MKLTRTVRFNPVLFNMVPLVNVVFLLLFFFALSKTFVLQPGISVNLPVASFLQVPQQNAQIISVKAEPASTIFFHDQQMTFGALQRTLSTASQSQNRALIVRADKTASYDLVLAIVNCALANGYSVTLATAPAANANGELRVHENSR